jgi:predicted nucleic acid-binding protein
MLAALIDTNVLVYAYDRGEYAKQDRAIQVLEFLQRNGVGRLSVQSFAEFFSVTTKGQRPILTIQQAIEQVAELAQTWQVFDLTPQVVLAAARGVRDHQLAFWDAQIWAVARLNQIPLILSEDFQSDAIIEGVRFLNPFVPTFDVQAILV